MPLQYVYGINLGVSVLRCLRLLRVFKVTKYVCQFMPSQARRQGGVRGMRTHPPPPHPPRSQKGPPDGIVIYLNDTKIMW